MEEVIYTCGCCKTEIGWDSADSIKGNIWDCESCGNFFCTICFMEHTGEINPPGSEIYEKVLCPSCFK